MIWESKELKTMRDVQNDLYNGFRFTEMEMSESSCDTMLGQLHKVSEVMNDAISKLEEELKRVTKRDADIYKDHTCSVCESDKIYVCSPCLTEMSKNV